MSENINVSYTYDEANDKFWISISNAKANREVIKKIREVFGLVPVGLIKNLEPEEAAEEEIPDIVSNTPAETAKDEKSDAVVEEEQKKEVVETAKSVPENDIGLKCPDCGKPVVFGDVISCDCGFKLETNIKNRQFTEEEISVLFKDGQTPFLDGFVAATGRVYPASIKLQKGGKLSWTFPPKNNK